MTLDRRRFLANSLSATLAASLPSDAASAVRIPLIDAHVHIFRRDPAFPYAEGAHPPPQDFPVETLIDLMRANGVARTVIIQVIHYRYDNRYLASVLKRFPTLFHGVCRVDPEDPAAPDHLSRLTQEGFHGVRLSPADTADGDWIHGPLMPPLWRRCAQLKVPMTLLISPSRIPDLLPLIEAHPDLDVVIDHMADCPLDRPDQLKLLLDLARYPRVFVKISDMWSLSKQPYPYPDAQEQVKRLYDRFGAKRLMWDTNWPVSLAQLSYAKAVELYRVHLNFFTQEDRQDMLWRTAQRVWPFGL